MSDARSRPWPLVDFPSQLAPQFIDGGMHIHQH
jgi:hypothetical protein